MLTANQIIEYAIKYARKPAIGLNYAFIKLGLYGGASVDFFAMGQQAGKKIAAILSGTPAGICQLIMPCGWLWCSILPGLKNWD